MTAPAELEAILEGAYWAFDAERKATGAEGAAFKRQMHGMMTACLMGAEKATVDFFQGLREQRTADQGAPADDAG